MKLAGVLDPVNRVMSKLSRGRVFALALASVLLISIPDTLFGYEISLSVFYLCPVGIATWYAGRTSGVAIALISTLSSLAEYFTAAHVFTSPAIMAWNGLLHLGFMLTVAYLLDSLRSRVEIVQELARSDPLTGIFNRRAFLEHLQYRLDLAARDAKSIALAYIDLDDFKRLNDDGGHAQGDRVLKRVASTLRESIRRSDVVARLGGDEFIVLINGADRTGVESLVAKVREALLRALDDEQVSVTCSVGCMRFPAPPPDADAAIRAADALMYKVKRQGKNAVAFGVFDDQTRRAAETAR
jgi:diguanylate cyclase (GGDEF)-like protein